MLVPLKQRQLSSSHSGWNWQKVVGEVALAEGSLVNSWFNHCYGVSHLGSTWWVGEATWINQDWKTSKRVPACPLNSMPLRNRFCSTSERGAASATIMVSHGCDLSAVSDVFVQEKVSLKDESHIRKKQSGNMVQRSLFFPLSTLVLGSFKTLIKLPYNFGIVIIPDSRGPFIYPPSPIGRRFGSCLGSCCCLGRRCGEHHQPNGRHRAGPVTTGVFGWLGRLKKHQNWLLDQKCF